VIIEAEAVPDRTPGYCLPGSWYTSETVFSRDMERIFFRHWLFAGLTARIPKAGDFFTFEVGREPLIVVRSDDGVVHAMWNVCRHRGSRICQAGAGNTRVLVCPYHQWVYGTDGSLMHARLMPDSFDRSRHGLVPARVELVEGLIFVALGDHAPDFVPFREAIGPRLRGHHLETARIAHIEKYQIAANWKLVVENSRECYHCGAGHPQYCRAVGFAAAVGSDELKQQDVAIRQSQEARLRAIGVPVEELPFTPNSWFHYRRFFPRPPFVTESMDGKPVAPLMGTLPDWNTGIYALVTYPNVLLEACSDYVMTLRLSPVGPQTTAAEVCWVVRGDAKEGTDYDRDRLTEFWRLTSEQDWRLCEGNQLGVNSSRYQPGPYSPEEKGVEQFTQWYTREIAG
jgi:Rieske 2Fe-2S family protein